MMPAHAIGFRVKSGFAVAIALRGPASAPIAVVRRVVMMSDPKMPPMVFALYARAAACEIEEPVADNSAATTGNRAPEKNVGRKMACRLAAKRTANCFSGESRPACDASLYSVSLKWAN